MRYHPRHAVQHAWHAGRAAILACALAFTGAGLAVAESGVASATTATCTNVATPVSSPVGCGGIYLPLLGSGIQPNGTSLTLTAASDFWNAEVNLTPYDPTNSTQDFTVYQVCEHVDVVQADRVASWNATKNPCGDDPGDTPVLDPASGFGEYVAEATPLGQHIGGALNNVGNLCLSVEAVKDGPHHAVRWHAVLRTCNTYGANFTAGVGGTSPNPGVTADGHGLPGVVNLANHWQTWSPIPGNGGYVLGNNALSNNFFNHPFVLDARGGHGPSVIAFPENDNANEIWKVIGCTNPVTSLTPGFFNCP